MCSSCPPKHLFNCVYPHGYRYICISAWSRVFIVCVCAWLSISLNILLQRDLTCHMFQLVLAVTKTAVCERVWHSWGKAREQAISSKINCNLLPLNWPMVRPVPSISIWQTFNHLVKWPGFFFFFFLVKPQFPLGLCQSVPELCHLKTCSLFKGEVKVGRGETLGTPCWVPYTAQPVHGHYLLLVPCHR